MNNQIIENAKTVVRWWWASFEMNASGPSNGIARWLVALVMGIYSSIITFGAIGALLSLINDYLSQLLTVAVVVFAYFIEPKCTFAHTYGHLKGWIKSVLGLKNTEEG